MMTSQDLFDEVSVRLFQVRMEVGDDVFRRAAGAALVAIGRAVLDEAERRARDGKDTNVVQFPLSRVIRSLSRPLATTDW